MFSAWTFAVRADPPLVLDQLCLGSLNAAGLPETVSLRENPQDWWAVHRPFHTDRFPHSATRVVMSPAEMEIYRSFFLPRVNQLERLTGVAAQRALGVVTAHAEVRLSNEAFGLWRRLVSAGAPSAEIAEAHGRAIAWHRSALSKMGVLAEAIRTGQPIPAGDRATLASGTLRLTQNWLELNGYRTRIVEVRRDDDTRRGNQQIIVIEPDSPGALGELADTARLLRRYDTETQTWQLTVSPTEMFFTSDGAAEATVHSHGRNPRVNLPLSEVLNLRYTAGNLEQVVSLLRQERQADRGLPSAFQGTFAVVRADDRGIESANSMQTFVANSVPRPRGPLTTRAERDAFSLELAQFVRHQNSQAAEMLPHIVFNRFILEQVRRALGDQLLDHWPLSLIRRDGRTTIHFEQDRMAFDVKIDADHVTVFAGTRRFMLPRTDGPLGDAVRALEASAIARHAGQTETRLTMAEREHMWRIFSELQRRLEVMEVSTVGHMAEVAELIAPLGAYFTTRSDADWQRVMTALDGVATLSSERHTLRGLLATPVPREGQTTTARPALVAGPAEGLPYQAMPLVRAGLAAAPGSVERNRAMETIGMDAVIAQALSRGWSVRAVSQDNAGYDVLVEDPASGQRFYIEVKARHAGADSVTLSRRESEFAVAHPDNWLLAVVLVDAEGNARVHLRNRLELAPLAEVEDGRVINMQRLLARPPSALPSIAPTGIRNHIPALSPLFRVVPR